MRRTIVNNFMSRPLIEGARLTFEGCEQRLKDPTWVESTLRNPLTRVLGIHKNDVAFEMNPPASEGARATIARLAAVVPEVTKLPEGAKAPELYFLGLDTKTEVPYFARELLESEAENINEGVSSQPDKMLKMIGLRAAAMDMIPEEAALAAQGKSLIEFHKSHRYCGNCGSLSLNSEAGRYRKCGNCGATTYPRVNPVAIMMVLSPDGTRCALGQTKQRHIGNMYSCLAGFIDQGESLEHAVCRETLEESGLTINPATIRFHSSQPWPFPFQLMLGCVGVATTDTINFDPEEMHDVQWFDRETVRKALKSESDILEIPPRMAIANILMQSWVDGDHDELFGASKL